MRISRLDFETFNKEKISFFDFENKKISIEGAQQDLNSLSHYEIFFWGKVKLFFNNGREIFITPKLPIGSKQWDKLLSRLFQLRRFYISGHSEFKTANEFMNPDFVRIMKFNGFYHKRDMVSDYKKGILKSLVYLLVTGVVLLIFKYWLI